MSQQFFSLQSFNVIFALEMGGKRPTTLKKNACSVMGIQIFRCETLYCQLEREKKKKEAKADKYCFILTSILNEEVKIKASVCEAGLVNCQ